MSYYQFYSSKIKIKRELELDLKQTDNFQEICPSELPCLQHEENSLTTTNDRFGMSNTDNKCHANALFQAILYDLITEFQQ